MDEQEIEYKGIRAKFNSSQFDSNPRTPVLDKNGYAYLVATDIIDLALTVLRSMQDKLQQGLSGEDSENDILKEKPDHFRVDIKFEDGFESDRKFLTHFGYKDEWSNLRCFKESYSSSKEALIDVIEHILNRKNGYFDLVSVSCITSESSRTFTLLEEF